MINHRQKANIRRHYFMYTAVALAFVVLGGCDFLDAKKREGRMWYKQATEARGEGDIRKTLTYLGYALAQDPEHVDRPSRFRGA